MKKAKELYDLAFSGPRTPRSKEYKMGVWAALCYWFHGAEIIVPWPAGTVKYDAFFAGVDEGNLYGRNIND